MIPDPEPPRKLLKLEVDKPKEKAVGTKAVVNSLKHIRQQAGINRGSQALHLLNQQNGFDCPSCAWPDPDDKRSKFEFCENGAKAVATEITKKRINADFFAKYSVTELAQQTDYWLNDSGRITEPFLLDKGATHYRAVSWEAAFQIISEELNSTSSPDEGVFYTSGRASNEAAFLYQLFVRQYGTNNLPDCSNMCHESSGAALNETIGVGKGTVTLEDIETTDCLLIMGQNPGTNHPRMLTSLEKMVKNGGKIISVNPLFETGLRAFSHPQKLKGILGQSTPLASQHLPVRINGDLAFLKGMLKCVIDENALDHDFIKNYSTGFEIFQFGLESITWTEIESGSGLTELEIRKAAKTFIEAKEAITCWAMGLTQHHNSVATIREVVNLHLITGKIGRPKSGLCPVRGHSNVQGDRTMGIWEKMPESFLAALDQEFNFKSPRKQGYDTVESIEAMLEGKIRVFIGLGGNFLSASPDTHTTAKAMGNCALTAHISTKLNRGHLITGKRGLILPCLGRTESDLQKSGPQFVSVENSMGVVQKSEGRLRPASDKLKSEIAIICGIAQATLKKSEIPWQEFENNYDLIRERIERVIPGFENYNQRVRRPGGFYLPNAVKKRIFKTNTNKANFTINHLNPIVLKPDQLLLQTFRSHDQFNTTIYGNDDRYRGIKNERRVIFMNREDMKDRNISPHQPVDITSHYNGKTRTAELFLAIPYDTPKGCTAAYYPEANVLVPLEARAETSQTPISKSVVVTITPSRLTH